MFGWFYLISVFGFVIFLVSLALSRIRRRSVSGRRIVRPSYASFLEVSMLLAAGFGVGLVCYRHGRAPCRTIRATLPSVTCRGRRLSPRATPSNMPFFDWGVHQWASFSVVGLIIAYFQFRKGQAGLVSSVLSSVTAKHPKVRRYGPSSGCLRGGGHRDGGRERRWGLVCCR